MLCPFDDEAQSKIAHAVQEIVPKALDRMGYASSKDNEEKLLRPIGEFSPLVF